MGIKHWFGSFWGGEVPPQSQGHIHTGPGRIWIGVTPPLVTPPITLTQELLEETLNELLGQVPNAVCSFRDVCLRLTTKLGYASHAGEVYDLLTELESAGEIEWVGPGDLRLRA